MGARRWTDEELLVAGRRMVGSIWQRDVVLLDGRPYPAAGDWAATAPIIALSPGAFTPYAYEVFADADPAHDWRALIETGYLILAAVSAPDSAVNKAGLPPDWVGLDTATGDLVQLPAGGPESMRYGESAVRSFWRTALHFRWTQDPRAQAQLQRAEFLRNEVARRGAPARVYGRDGSIIDSSPGGASTAATMAALLTFDPGAGQDLYASQVVGGTNRLGAGIYWGDLNDLRAQEWGWLATAFYADRLPQIWPRGINLPSEPPR
jgi:endo-1,4-beta-D-glucanase Y